MVTKPFSPIFKNPLILNHSLGRALTWLGDISQEASQLKLNIIPPPARVLLFIKERLPIDVLIVFINNVLRIGCRFNRCFYSRVGSASAYISIHSRFNFFI